MILLTIFALLFLLLVFNILFTVGFFGTIGILIFGDAVVCIAIFIWLIKKILFRK